MKTRRDHRSVIPPTRVRIIPGGSGSRLSFPVRRRIFIVAIFLLAGAVVNVAVAWGIAGASTNCDTMQRQFINPGGIHQYTHTGFGCAVAGHLGPAYLVARPRESPIRRG